MFDCDTSGAVDRAEVTHALAALLPFGVGDVVRYVEANWSRGQRWDRDGNGSVDAAEFLVIVRAVERLNLSTAVPPLDDPKWFGFWDADLSGSLDTQELTLALLHTFNLTGAARQADRASFVENVGVIIMLLDPNQDGTFF